MLFKVDFITYKGIVKSFETDKLNVPTSEGRRTILSNHMPIMMSLVMGVIETSKDNVLAHYVINSGVLYFKDNYAKIVCNNVLDVKDIDVERAIRAKKTSQRNLEKMNSDIEKTREQFKIKLHDNLIDAYNKYNETR